MMPGIRMAGSNWSAVCSNEACGQFGVPKPSNGLTLFEGEDVRCGECTRICELRSPKQEVPPA